MENNIDQIFWIELKTTINDLNKFTNSEDYKLIGDIFKKYSIQATINSDIKPVYSE